MPKDATTTPQAATDAPIDQTAVLAQVEAGVALANSIPSGEPAAPPPADPAEGTDPLEKPAEPADPAKPAEPEKPADAPAAEPEPEKEPEKPEVDEPAKAARPSDEFGELDDRVSERTRERYAKLKDGYDELHKTLAEVSARERQWVEGVSATGATPEQFAQSLGYLELVNRGDRVSLEKARELIKTEYEFLSKHLGYAVEGHDPLDAHPDLKERVENEALERDVALELARRRAGDKIDTVANNAKQTTEERRQAEAAAANGLRALAAELREKNPAVFTYKAAALKPTIDEIAANYPASEWVERVRRAYARIPDPPMAAPIGGARGGAAAPNPIRPTGSGSAGGGLKREPQSALEAVQKGMANWQTG
jgi:hypothetical protein